MGLNVSGQPNTNDLWKLYAKDPNVKAEARGVDAEAKEGINPWSEGGSGAAGWSANAGSNNFNQLFAMFNNMDARTVNGSAATTGSASVESAKPVTGVAAVTSTGANPFAAISAINGELSPQVADVTGSGESALGRKLDIGGGNYWKTCANY